ncbi:unnamed protein product [Leptidea sinapis]|uniref:Uncharacterized protein n=1 Tax=Leptidea sinapis TaxID=189913 RepID=A0A5E4PML0_9NEOP|nr:unnamed protein product [Leptidea sinapis]
MIMSAIGKADTLGIVAAYVDSKSAFNITEESGISTKVSYIHYSNVGRWKPSHSLPNRWEIGDVTANLIRSLHHSQETALPTLEAHSIGPDDQRDYEPLLPSKASFTSRPPLEPL